MEDSKADLFLIRQAIVAAEIDATVVVVHDGEQALNYIDKANDLEGEPYPDLVLLDLNLPRKDGIEVLRHMRRNAACRNALVLIVSSSDSAKDREAAEALGFSGYFRKPSSYAEFMKLGPMVRQLLTGGSNRVQ